MKKTILRAWTLAVAAVAAMGIFASTAMALPAGFWGVVPQSGMTDEQFQRLSRGGVESTRLPISWEHVQPANGGSFDWSGVDDQVEAASKAGIKVLPFLTGAPTWAVRWATIPQSGGLKAPGHLPVTGVGRAGWISFLTAAVARYGPGGGFWSEHPGVPSMPLRNWQIWNEPNFKYFVAKPNPTEYGKLVKISFSALKAADPGAQVILAGLFSRPKGARDRKTGKHKSLNWFASDFLERMYKTSPGVKTKFNGAALHPYTINARELPEVTEELRNTLKDNGDAGKPLWITEISWSSKPKTGSNLFGKGRAGQAKELRTAFTALRNKQRPWKVKSVFWFSVDDVAGACNFCDGSGLFASGFKPKPSWFSYVKFAGGTP
ncbi:MAG TPA: glycosyl hydrolase [Solirubrobacterales bacterium]|nr:glycosyl hydrolase [Solirubrobacterales bacterium]